MIDDLWWECLDCGLQDDNNSGNYPSYINYGYVIGSESS